MRHCRRPPNPDTIEELAGILNEHTAYDQPCSIHLQGESR